MLPERGMHGTTLALIYAGFAFAGWVVNQALGWPWENYLVMAGFLATALGVSGYRARGEYSRDARVAEAQAGYEPAGSPTTPADTMTFNSTEDVVAESNAETVT